MWSRAELKGRAKQAFRRNYWKCVLVALIFMFITGDGTSNDSDRSSTNQPTSDVYYEYGSDGSLYMYEDTSSDSGVVTVLETFIPIVGTFGLSILFVIGVVCILLDIFVLKVLEVGCCGFFIENTYSPAELGELVSGFRDGYYGKNVLTQFLRNLFIFLWSLLLIIPGIVKSYEYCMIPYILADYPHLSHKEAFEMSKAMMDGNKWNAFVLDLSFIGWVILSAITFNIVGVFYANPYRYATKAELYMVLKERVQGIRW